MTMLTHVFISEASRRRLAFFGSLVVMSTRAWAQLASPLILKVDLENVVGYWDDGTDFSKLGSVTSVTTPAPTRRIFQSQGQIGDITAVNGQPAKGTFKQLGSGTSFSYDNRSARIDIHQMKQRFAQIYPYRVNLHESLLRPPRTQPLAKPCGGPSH